MPEKAADQFHFADQVVRRTRALGHPLCAGLDPFLDRIPRLFHSGSMRPNDPISAALRKIMRRPISMPIVPLPLMPLP